MVWLSFFFLTIVSSTIDFIFFPAISIETSHYLVVVFFKKNRVLDLVVAGDSHSTVLLMEIFEFPLSKKIKKFRLE